MLFGKMSRWRAKLHCQSYLFALLPTRKLKFNIRSLFFSEYMSFQYSWLLTYVPQKICLWIELLASIVRSDRSTNWAHEQLSSWPVSQQRLQLYKKKMILLTLFRSSQRNDDASMEILPLNSIVVAASVAAVVVVTVALLLLFLFWAYLQVLPTPSRVPSAESSNNWWTVQFWPTIKKPDLEKIVLVNREQKKWRRRRHDRILFWRFWKIGPHSS